MTVAQARHFFQKCLLAQVMLSLLICSADLRAAIGARWQFVTPLTRMASVNDLIWDGNQFVAVGSGGYLLSSSNGQQWRTLISGAGSELHAIAIDASGRWLAAGDGGTIVGGLDQRIGAPEVTPVSADLFDIATDGSVFVAVGSSASLIRRGSDGVWLRQEAPSAANGNTIRSIAWQSGLWLAVGDKGTALTSPDGRTWTEQTTNATVDLQAVMWSGTASLWVAVGSGGNILTSTDGFAWTLAYTAAAAVTLRGIWEQGGALFVVGDQSRVLTGTLSVGAINWQAVTTPLTTSLKLITGTSNGSRQVIMGEAGTVLWSDDGGVTWTSQLPDTQNISDVLWNGTQWYAVADAGHLFQSTDGLNWTSSLTVVPTSRDLNGIAWSGSRYVIVADQGTLLWSNDGATWNQVTVTCPTSGAALNPTPSCDLMGVTWNATAAQFVAVGSLGTILNSSDGQTWTARAVDRVLTTVSSATTPITSDHQRPLMRDVAYHGLFVAVGYKGSIWTSTDGDTWTERGSGLTDAPLENVVWDSHHAQWQIVGQGVQLSSTDGINWVLKRALTSTNGDGLAWLNDTALLSDRILGVGQSGTIMTSPSGVDWTVIDSGQGDTNLRAVDDQSQAAVAVGEGGLIMLSEDFPDLVVSGGAGVTSIQGDNAIAYAFTAQNQAGLNASDVRLSLTLPSDVVFTQTPSTTQGSCTTSGIQLSCAFGALAATASAVVNFSATATKAGTKSFVVSVSSDQTDANDLDNVMVSSVTVTADLPSSVAVGPKLSGVGGLGLGSLLGLLVFSWGRKFGSSVTMARSLARSRCCEG